MKKSSLTIALNIFIIMILFTSINQGVKASLSDTDKWWNGDWGYRKQITVTEVSGYQLSNYPIELTFQHGGKVQPDGDDIRVVIDNTETPYYLDSINSTYAKIYFEINCSSLESKTIFVYYGNVNANNPNYPSVPLEITEGNTGYAQIDNRVYLRWDNSITWYGNPVVILKDFYIDFGNDENPLNDNDLITDYGGYIGGLGRHKWDSINYGLGNYLNYNKNPIFVEINFENASFRIFKNNKWIKTTQADWLHEFGNNWDYAKANETLEENIIDGVINYSGGSLVYFGKSNPGWLALRSSTNGDIIAGVGLNIGSEYNYHLSAKEFPAYDCVISFDTLYLEDKDFNDQPSNTEIYWFGDHSDNYSNINRMATIFNNPPSTYVDEEEIITPHPVIDTTFIIDTKVDVGSIQNIGFHLKWSDNNTDVIDGRIYVTSAEIIEEEYVEYNVNEYLTNGTGWIFFNVSSQTIGKNSWGVSSVNASGVRYFENLVENLTIIWDQVNVTLDIEANRINVGDSANIGYSATYLYDGKPFNGTVILNDTNYSLNIVGKKTFKVGNITDPLYGLSAFVTNEIYCIYDRLVVNARVESMSLGSITVFPTLNYEFDGSMVPDANVTVNGVLADNLGNGLYEATVSTWMPFLALNLQINRQNFYPSVNSTIQIAFGNLLLESLIIIILILLPFLIFRSWSLRKK